MPELPDQRATGARVIFSAARVIADGESALNSLHGFLGASLYSDESSGRNLAPLIPVVMTRPPPETNCSMAALCFSFGITAGSAMIRTVLLSGLSRFGGCCQRSTWYPVC